MPLYEHTHKQPIIAKNLNRTLFNQNTFVMYLHPFNTKSMYFKVSLVSIVDFTFVITIPASVVILQAFNWLILFPKPSCPFPLYPQAYTSPFSSATIEDVCPQLIDITLDKSTFE